MSMRREIKSCLIANLEASLDPYMKDHRFSRRTNSLVYKRQHKGSAQIIDVDFQIHPKDNPNAAAAIYPDMKVLIPTVDEILSDMIDGNRTLMEGITGGTSRQPIGFTSEKAHTGRWYVYQPDSVPGIVEGIQALMERWTMPFLDVYATPEDIVAVDEQEDGRMVVDRAHLMRVVAAALACNRKDYAQSLMEKKFGSLGLRRRYQQVHDYVEQAT